MKFYWYNNSHLRTYLQTKRKNPDTGVYDFGDPRYKKLNSIQRAFNPDPPPGVVIDNPFKIDNMFGMLHDNSNHVPHPFNVVTKTPYQYRTCDKTFEQVCLDVAKKIADTTTQKISVNWSGGIDSTIALVALLRTVSPDRIAVTCDQSSIDEYPEFYRDFIKDRIETLDILEWCKRAPEFYSISGDAGDAVFGSILEPFWITTGTKLNMPWRDWLADVDWVDKQFVEEFCTWSGVNIHTVLDLRTWFFLCCKWQDKAMKLYTDCPGLNKSNASPFFDYDDSFQIWTMNNLDQLSVPDWASYKMPGKDFIYQYHPDKNYYNNKTKGYSVNMTYRSVLWKIKSGTNKFAIDTNYGNHVVPCWPFVDQVHFENWNDQYHLIPPGLLEV